MQVTTEPIETIFCAPDLTSTCGTTNASGRTLRFDIKVAALDLTRDWRTNYDTLVFFDADCGRAARAFCPALHRTRICSRRRAVGEVLL